MSRQPGFFDLEDRYTALSKAGDPLEGLSASVDFEVFRNALVKALKYSDRRKGGRPPYDPVLMFKILVLQTLYSLSDDQAEFLCRDRLSFMRFLGLSLGDAAPDAKTIWLFRERLKEKGAIDTLLTALIGISKSKACWPWVGRPWMLLSSKRCGSVIPTKKKRPFAKARRRTAGRTNLQRWLRKIPMPAGHLNGATRKTAWLN